MTLPAPVPELPGELLEGASVLPYRSAMLPHLPKHGVFVEVGVGLGDWSRLILDTVQPSRFIAIDSFALHTLPELWGRTGPDWFAGGTHADAYRARFAAEVAAGIVSVQQGDSVARLRDLPDHSADIIYLDADHTYPSVRAELDIVKDKIKPDGWILINDYILVDTLRAPQPYGVIYAAHEFMINHGWRMQYLALQTNMYCDVALRRADPAQLPHWPKVRVDEADVYRALSVPEPPSAAAHAALVEANAILRQQIDILRASTSWRLTAPLRALGRRFARRPGAGG